VLELSFHVLVGCNMVLGFAKHKEDNNLSVERLCDTKFCTCQGGISSVDANMLNIFGEVTIFGWE
jgi:hypothetical protein